MTLIPNLLNRSFVQIPQHTPKDLNCGNPTAWKDTLGKFRNLIPITQLSAVNTFSSDPIELKASSPKPSLSLASLASVGAISHLQEKDYGKALAPILTATEDVQPTFDKHNFALKLSQQYGPKLASNFVFAKEGPIGTFSRLFKSLPDRLTPDQMKQCIVGIRHHLTVDVLEDAWKKFRHNDLENLTILKHLKKNSFDLTKSRLADLSTKELDRFIKAFENDQAAQLVIDNNQQPNAVKGGTYAYRVRQLQKNGTPNSVEFSYAKAELLSKLAYSKPESIQDGQVLPMLKDNGEIYYAKLIKQIHKKGVHILFYVPLSNDSTSDELIIACRGTAGFESARRDVSQGIGLEALNACKEEICSVFDQVKPKKITSSGHSLGALDALRSIVMLLEKCIDENDSSKSAESLPSFETFAFCYPKPTRTEGEELIKKLKGHPLADKITFNYASREFDGVTYAGESNFPLKSIGVKENRLIFPGKGFNPLKISSYHTERMFENGEIQEPHILLSSKSFDDLKKEFNETYQKELNQQIDGYLNIPEAPIFEKLRHLEKEIDLMKSHYTFTDTGIHNNYKDYLAPGESFLSTVLKIIQAGISYI